MGHPGLLCGIIRVFVGIFTVGNGIFLVIYRDLITCTARQQQGCQQKQYDYSFYNTLLPLFNKNSDQNNADAQYNFAKAGCNYSH